MANRQSKKTSQIALVGARNSADTMGTIFRARSMCSQSFRPAR